MVDALVRAFQLPDLRRKVIFTFAMLLVFRVFAHIPVPGVNAASLANFFQNNQLMGMLDLFSGGAMTTFSIVAMGVYPYITAQIIMQLLVGTIPALEELSSEGEAGRLRINQYINYLTVPLAALQAYGTGVLIHNQTQGQLLPNFGLFGPDWLSTVALVITMTAGTVFLVWLGELITENGIGNGVSIIIFAGIVSRLPQIVGQSLASGNYGSVLLFAVLGVITVAAIVVVQEAQRRIPVQYAKRIRGNRMYGGQSTHIPLRVNSAGMIPLIFAMSIMLLPTTIANYLSVAPGWVGGAAKEVLILFNNGTGPLYWLCYFLLVVMFTFFYTMVIFQQQKLAENLQKYGGFIPGIRPGRPTEGYLNGVLFRITILGALFLGVVAILPFFAQGISTTLILSSTGLLIVVGVVLDTMKQLEAQLMMRNYEGFIK
jgi:preprotein translocase subunit SecY